MTDRAKNEKSYLVRHGMRVPNSTVQVLLLLFFLLAIIVLVSLTHVLLIPLLLSITLYFILNPLVNVLERRGYSRTVGALIASFIFYTPSIIVTYYTCSSVYEDLARFESEIPKYVTYAQSHMSSLEESIIHRFAFLNDMNISTWLIDLLRQESANFLSRSPAILNTILWAAILLPLFTFFFLRDAVAIRNLLLNITPNQFFEQAFSVSYQIERKIGAFIIAKLGEAFLVGLLTLIGLTVISFPYSFLFSVIAGLTNIIPYFGPIFGYLPIVAIPFFVPAYESLLYPAIIVSVSVNVLDMIVIFPLLVSKVIDLHPLVVLLSVIIGGGIAGPIGLLVAIPVAATLKIFIYEILSISPKIFRA